MWTIIQSHDGEGPRVATICCNQKWAPTIIKATRDAVTMAIEAKNLRILVTNIYIPPTADISESLDLQQRILADYPNEQHLLAGDFNAHSETWGYPHTDLRGRAVEDFVASNDLSIHNEPECLPTFETVNGKGWPDLTLSSAALTPKIKNWTVEDSITNSDHRYITYSINQQHERLVMKRYKLTRSKTTQFSRKARPILNRLLMELPNTITVKDAEELTNNLISDLQIICDSTFALKTPKMLHAANWWTRDLRTQRSRTRAMRRRMKAERDQEARQLLSIEYNKAQAKYKKAILRAKPNLKAGKNSALIIEIPMGFCTK
ncbi:uncharacterized protein LOC118190394 [Stegodyphus dumicola]|uniref:uncharacterized protein LOC118190394 n=1 Tax=Stegodyphus dumicola TaxID=202533 RepID=UPI0015ADCB4C|nr:uncharacterized protein LOC118190394 [Stegodyphus dumicola]